MLIRVKTAVAVALSVVCAFGLKATTCIGEGKITRRGVSAGETAAASERAEPAPVVPFLALTGRPTVADVVRKLDALKRDGIDQVVLYGRSGLEYDYLGEDWMQLIETFCAEAERRDMYVWLYDEFCWPSGSCNKRLLKENDEWRYSEWGVWRDGDGTLKWELARSTQVSNVFEPEATRRFMALTHEAYEVRLKPYFARGRIRAIFTDEPGTPGGISFGHPVVVRYATWRGLDEAYAAATGGRSLKDDVERYVNDPGEDAVWPVYLRLKAERFREAYFKPIDDWCRKVGILSTGHLTEELCMTSGPLIQGDLLKVLKSEGLPGIDDVFTHVTKGDIEWITLAAAQHASNRRTEGPGGMVELYALGPNDMSFGRMRQMLWLQALHGVDSYLLSMEVMDHRGLLEKHGYMSPMQEGQPWRADLGAFVAEARVAAAFARKPYRCEVAIRYPQREAARQAYRHTGGRAGWNILQGPDLRSLIAETRARQIECELIEEDEPTTRSFVLSVVPCGYREERTGRFFPTAGLAAEFLLDRTDGEVRVYERDGKPADELILRRFEDGSVAMLNLSARTETRQLVYGRRGGDRLFELPWRGVLTLAPGEVPADMPTGVESPVGVANWSLSIDRDNLHRFLFPSNGVVRFTVGRETPAVRFVLRDWPSRARVELDGLPLDPHEPCLSLPIEYRPVYRETTACSLEPGEHVLKLVSGESDDNYFLPLAVAAGRFAADADGLRPLPEQVVAGVPLDEIGLGEFVGKLTYRAHVTAPAGKDCRIGLPFSQANVRVAWNGRDLGLCAWAPYRWTLPAGSAGTAGDLAFTVATAAVNFCGDDKARRWHGVWRDPLRARRSEGLASVPQWYSH